MYRREKQFRQENDKPKKSHRHTPSFSSSLLDEICRSIDAKPDPKPPQTAAFSKVEKWMESDRTVFRRRSRCENAVFPDNDPLMLTELYANRPKPVRTARGGEPEKDCYLFDEYEEHERNRSAAGDDLIKSKSRAMKIYANLKKMKQPVSPGARLTSFFNSIFSGLNRKKSREAGRNDRVSAAPSPAPAKMIARCSTKSLDTMGDGIGKTARFDRAARVVVDRDLDRDRDRDAMPRGLRSVGGGRPPLPPNAFRNWRKCDFDKVRYDGEDEEEEEDAVSESSSDLFELDHLSIFGNKDRFCEELPVYETTYFDKNCRLFR